ncbi:Gfo/Idh/MocA family oxidoreductase [Streptomyces sp. P38-E01]|uniref:Inositol 2-dehydrogenase n=1 Tax=Streptomyces tardus TaxID=2780544 RepID=A0A949N698_9ACTN|nr:Gfo/Idh/MocA family oxidoreductase [Streptomyces tardus]MBU7598837.1 Gfo/Idh/MocA family oxidoreductase [Streptomyces tardus]
MSKTPLGVAVIGTGRMGADHVHRLRERVSGAEVVAVADVDGDRAAALAEAEPACRSYSDAGRALAAPGVDAVLIASPGPAHEEVLLESLERGLPVLCEKPLTPDPAGALRVLAAEQRFGSRLIQVGFMRRYDAEFLALKALLDRGELGQPLMMHCAHRNVGMPAWFTEQMMINDSVVHEIDCTRWLWGQEITAVTVVKPGARADSPVAGSDPQLVLLETSGGALVTVEIFAACGFGYQVRAEVVCSRGTATVGTDDARPGVRVAAAGRWGGGVDQDFLTRFGDAYQRELQEWVDAARSGRATGPSTWDGYAAAAVCAAGVTAQREGVRTPVELAERPPLYGESAAGRPRLPVG